MQHGGHITKDLLGPRGVPVGGGGGPSNTVAPAIEAAAVIGTEITGDDGTWTGSPTLTYQWQRYTSGAWADIALATDKDYTPVDADWGLALRLVVTADGSVAANSNSTNLTSETPAQSLGSELVANGNMETGDPPSNWTAGGSETLLSSVADERTGGAGAASLSIARNGVYAYPRATQKVTASAGSMAYLAAWRKNVDAVDITFRLFTPNIIRAGNAAAWTNVCILAQAQGDLSIWLSLTTSGDTQAGRFDDVSAKIITTNTQLTAPSANMLITQLYTLPATPIYGDALWLVVRASDFAAGNYWLVELLYTGSRWDITLDSVASYTRTAQQTASNIGATNGLRINANGDSLVLETTANGGTSWTQRGSEESNSLYNTATGVNAVWTSNFTAGALTFADPT